MLTIIRFSGRSDGYFAAKFTTGPHRPLSLGGHVESRGNKKTLFLHGKPRPDANSVRGLSCKNKAFYSSETHHGRRVTKVF